MVFKTSFFYQEAKNYIESEDLIEEGEIAKNDVTEKFIKEIGHNMLINRESVNININSPVRSGKTTVNFACGIIVQEGLKKLGMTTEDFGIKNIARTQYELSKKMREPEMNNVFICIDEFDDLEETGENATVEKALLKHFSKIQAGRYIHRGYCSPSDVPDDESNIILNVIQADKEERITHCRLYYKILKGGTMYTQCIGHVNLYVGHIVKNWIEQGIEKRFYNFNKTEKDLKLIEEWRRKDWYTEYMCRKFEKMDLINKKGVFRTKEMDYADVILEIIEELFDLTKIGGLNQREIKNFVRSKCREKKVPLSLVGEQIITDRVDGNLNVWTRYFDNQRKMKKMKNMDEIKILQDGNDKLRKIAEKNTQELNELSDIKRNYYKGM